MPPQKVSTPTEVNVHQVPSDQPVNKEKEEEETPVAPEVVALHKVRRTSYAFNNNISPAPALVY